VTDRLSQLKEQFEATLKEREAAYMAKINEITANNDQGVYMIHYIKAVCAGVSKKFQGPLCDS